LGLVLQTKSTWIDRIIIMQQFLHLAQRNPAWMAAFISLVLSFVNVITDDLINSDGIVYSEVAGAFLKGDVQAAIAQFSWPFYPLLVGIISKVSFLSFETTAHLLNAGLLALLAYIFVRCSQIMGGDKWVAIFAAVLLLTNVTLNGYRDLIIRDHGYWAFFFTALFFFLQYNQTKLTKYALGFGISILIAVLFRIEGVVFALCAPLILLFQNCHWRERISQCVLPLVPIIVVGVAMLALLFSFPELKDKFLASSQNEGNLLGPLSYFQTTLGGIFNNIVEKGRLIEEFVFDVNARSMGTESIISILIMMLVVKTVSACGYIPAFFSLFTAFSNRLRNQVKGLKVVAGFMLINLLVLTTVLTSKTFLTPRYAMTLALLISLLAAFGLADFFRSQSSQYAIWRKRAKVFLIVILSYMFLDGFISISADKSYLRDASQWLKENAPAEARLFSNEDSVYYYSGRKVDRGIIFIFYEKTRFSRLPSVEETKPYDYVAVKVSRKQKGFEEKVIAWIGDEPVHRSGNKRGDMMLIFKVKK